MHTLRRIVHIVAIVLAVVVGVSLSAAVAVETVWFKQWLRGYIVRTANEHLNATLSIGNLSGNLFTGVSVDRVAVSMNGHDVISIEKVRASYSIRDLITHGIVIEHVDVTRPVVAMHREDSGWDLGRFIKQKADEASRDARRPITIRRLTIDDGVFSMARPGEPGTKLDPIDATLSLTYETGHYTFDIGRLSLRATNPSVPVEEATGVIEVHDGDLRLGGFALRTPETSLIVNGDVRRYASAPVFALRLHADTLSLPELRRMFPGVGTSRLKPAVDARLDGPLERLAVNVSLRSQAGEAGARGIAGLGAASKSFDGEVWTRRLDLAPFLDNAAQRSDIDADVAMKVRGTALDSLHGDIAVNAPKIHVRDYRVDRAHVSATLAGRTIRLADARARAFGAEVRATGFVILPNDSTRETMFDVRGRAGGLNLGNLPPSLKVPAADTNLTTAYHVAGSVPSGRAGTRVNGDVTLEASTVAGAMIAEGSTASFRTGTGDLEYHVDANVANLDLQRIGDEFHIQALAADRYRSSLKGHVTADVRGSALDTMNLTARGRLEASSIFSGEIPGMEFETAIHDNTLRVKTIGTLAGVDLSVAAGRPDLKGAVNGSVDAEIAFTGISNGIRPDAVEADVAAELQPSTVGSFEIERASIAGDYRNQIADVWRLDVAGADVTATCNGTLALGQSGESGLWIHANTSRLETVGNLAKQPLDGIATVDAVVGGNRTQFTVNGQVTGNGLKYRDYGALTAVSKFSAKVPGLDWNQASVTADSRATFVDIPGVHVNELTAKTEYANRRVVFDLTGSQPQRRLAAGGSLEFRPEDQEIRLERLEFDTQGQTWRAEPGHVPVITYGPGGIGVTDLQLANGDQRLQTEGMFGKRGQVLTVALQNVDLGVIDAWLLRPPQLSGRVDAKAEITGTREAPAVTTSFAIGNGKFRDVTFQSVGGYVKYSGEGADVDATLTQNASQWLSAKGHVPIAAFKANKQSGDHFDISVESSAIDLGLVQGVTSAVSGVRGTVQANMAVTGPSDDPRVAGAITVRDGAFKVEDTGVAYTNFAGKIDLLPDRIHIDDLHMLDNQHQQLTASGDLQVTGLQLGDVNLYFSASDFKVLDNEMGNVRVNSNLQLTGTLARPRIEGDLDVSTGFINLDPILARVGSTPYSTTAAEAPGLAVKESPSSPESSWRTPQLAVHVIIPDDLVVKAKDLKTSGNALGLGLGALNLTLGGDLNVSAEAGRPMTLVGAVTTVRGFYDFQGRRFQILRDGTVRFEGDPLDQVDPALNVTGERVIQAVTARVNVGGRMKRPTIELTSSPPLEQSDILALIVFNQPINELGAGQQVSLAQRAGVLAAGAVTSELTNSIANSLRLDQFEINVAPDPGVAAELVFGQQLSQNLYVRLQQGLGDRSQTNVILEYEFAKWLRLQTNVLQGTSSQEQLFQRVRSTGVDLVFSFVFK